MLFRCNILALVGGGAYPRYPPYKVMIWDDHQGRCIGELSFRSEVKAVKLRRDRVVVVLEHKIYVYNFADLKLIDHIETIKNPNGLCALCPYATNTVLVCPGLIQGYVRVELYDMKKTTIIPAHEGPLACFALNYNGTRLATASKKGTLIRIFDTVTGKPLQELRRGADRAEIYSICFDPLSTWLAVSSDKGTIHIFSLRSGGGSGDAKEEAKRGAIAGGAAGPGERKEAAQGGAAGGAAGAAGSAPAAPAAAVAKKSNPTSSFSFMKSLLPKYFSSEWSFAQFRVPDTKTIVAFGSEKNSIIVVSASGHFYKATFNPDKPGVDCKMEAHKKFIADEEEDGDV